MVAVVGESDLWAGWVPGGNLMGKRMTQNGVGREPKMIDHRVGIDVPFWGFVEHHQNKHLLEMKYPQ